MKQSARLALFAVLLGIVGCGGKPDRKPTFAVTGKVTDAAGKPVPHASVVFHPADAGTADKPRGKTDENGEFKLTTYDGNDGAPAGQYKVSVEQYLADPKNPDAGPTNRLPAKYASADGSGFTATVNAAPTDVPAFQIKR